MVADVRKWPRRTEIRRSLGFAILAAFRRLNHGLRYRHFASLSPASPQEGEASARNDENVRIKAVEQRPVSGFAMLLVTLLLMGLMLALALLAGPFGRTLTIRQEPGPYSSVIEH
jgi:hypothetical protein